VQVHDLRQFIHFANEGKIRSHLEEEQINEASCLNVVVNAIILWSTIYMQAIIVNYGFCLALSHFTIIEQLRKEGYWINDDDLKHPGPARHGPINPYGQYTFNVQVSCLYGLMGKIQQRDENAQRAYFSSKQG
jgi:hypothetical protein